MKHCLVLTYQPENKRKCSYHDMTKYNTDVQIFHSEKSFLQHALFPPKLVQLLINSCLKFQFASTVSAFTTSFTSTVSAFTTSSVTTQNKHHRQWYDASVEGNRLEHGTYEHHPSRCSISLRMYVCTHHHPSGRSTWPSPYIDHSRVTCENLAVIYTCSPFLHKITLPMNKTHKKLSSRHHCWLIWQWDVQTSLSCTYWYAKTHADRDHKVLYNKNNSP